MIAVSANNQTIDATTDNSKFVVNMLPQDPKRRSKTGDPRETKSKSMNQSNQEASPVNKIVVFDRFAWCYASIILVFSTQVLYYLFQVLDCSPVIDSVVYSGFSNKASLANQTIGGITYATGWEDKYYTRRDTSTECLGAKDGSVF